MLVGNYSIYLEKENYLSLLANKNMKKYNYKIQSLEVHQIMSKLKKYPHKI